MPAVSESPPLLQWFLVEPDYTRLRAEGYAHLPWDRLRKEFIEPAKAVGAANRAALDVPARELLKRFRRHERVALVGVRLADLTALKDLHDFALRPAWLAGCRLIVHADHTLDDLDPRGFVEDGFGHAFTLERARHLAAALRTTRDPPAPPEPPTPSRPLDPEQRTAVAAGPGVVQIIAPAGSGKTTVLVERVRELLGRGVPAERILCTTFNNKAAAELGSRLQHAGIERVEARTFHSLGRHILVKERLLPGEKRDLSLGQWRRLCTLASKETGLWVEPWDARSLIGNVKLIHLATAEEWAEAASPEEESQGLAAIYRLYEGAMGGAHDFDDQIMLAVRALRSRPDLRSRWQGRFDCVLVDEYQDIEPAQELLVQILAAPQDSLFCVGDEDQTLYGWRRASVRRIVELDQQYPSLQRIALVTNYRCPPAVVRHSEQLVARNALRFPKSIRARPERPAADGRVELREAPSTPEAAAWAAGELEGRVRGEVVVLARTTRLLRSVAHACADRGVRISAPEAVFESWGPRAAVEAHLRLAVSPRAADPDDVRAALRNPPRGLPLDGEQHVAERLRRGHDWARALAGLGEDGRLADAADLLRRLACLPDAGEFIRLLRDVGGIDDHFAAVDRTFGGTEQTALETLDDLERQAAGRDVGELVALLDQRRDALLAIRDDQDGIELATVHAAKGREWPTVIVFGFEAGQLPHHKALEVSPAAVADGEGEEAERRVAYVAMTRAVQRLILLQANGKPSPFSWEAGLVEPPEAPAPAASPAKPFQRGANSGRRRRAQRTPTRPQPTRHSAPRKRPPRVDGRRAVVKRSDGARGPAGIVADAPDHESGLRLAARALEGKLGDCGELTLFELLIEVPSTSSKRIRETVSRAGATPDERIGSLPPETVDKLVEVLLADGGG